MFRLVKVLVVVGIIPLVVPPLSILAFFTALFGAFPVGSLLGFSAAGVSHSIGTIAIGIVAIIGFSGVHLTLLRRTLAAGMYQIAAYLLVLIVAGFTLMAGGYLPDLSVFQRLVVVVAAIVIGVIGNLVLYSVALHWSSE